MNVKLISTILGDAMINKGESTVLMPDSYVPFIMSSTCMYNYLTVTSYWDLSILDLTYHNLSQFSTQVSIPDSAIRVVSQKSIDLVYKEERRTENQLIKTTTLSKTSVHKSGKTTNSVQQIPNGVYSNQTRTQVLE